MSSQCAQHCFRGCRSGRSACQCSDHTPHTATSWFAWSSSQKEASSEAGSQKKTTNSLLKTTWPRTVMSPGRRSSLSPLEHYVLLDSFLLHSTHLSLSTSSAVPYLQHITSQLVSITVDYLYTTLLLLCLVVSVVSHSVFCSVFCLLAFFVV